MAYWACTKKNCAGPAVHETETKGAPTCKTCKAKMAKTTLSAMPSAQLWSEISQVSALVGNKPESDALQAIGAALTAYQAKAGTAELVEILKVLKAVSDWCNGKVKKYGAKHPALGPYKATMPSKITSMAEIMTPSRATKEAWTQAKRPAVAELLELIVELIHQNGALTAAQSAWAPSNFTKPKAWKPGSPYKFLVAGCNDNGTNPAYIQEILNDPSLIASGFLSASVITDTVNTTWASSGFILKAPARNVFSAVAKDMASQSPVSHLHHAIRYAELVRCFIDHGLPKPDELVNSMKPIGSKYIQCNEVVMGGESLGSAPAQVEVIGIFQIMDAPPWEPGKKMRPTNARIAKYKKLSSLPYLELPCAPGSTVMCREETRADSDP